MKTGFLEEAPGVRSMIRLAIAWLMVLATLIVGIVVFYVVIAQPANAAVIAALGGVLTAIVYKGAVAIKYRTTDEEPSKGDEHG